MQGFPIGDGLNILRDRLRSAFKEARLQSSIDTRYKLVTAHSSIIRFCAPFENKQAFFELCNAYRGHDFGRIRLTDIELVFNDWYQSLSVTKSLAKVELN